MTMKKYLNLLEKVEVILPIEVIKLVEQKIISAGHAKVLVGLDNAVFVANKIKEKNLSVRQTEKFVKIFKNNKPASKFLDPNIQNLENLITEKIGLRVTIKNKKNNTGSIILEYKDLDQLNKMIEVIKANY